MCVCMCVYAGAYVHPASLLPVCVTPRALGHGPLLILYERRHGALRLLSLWDLEVSGGTGVNTVENKLPQF